MATWIMGPECPKRVGNELRIAPLPPLPWGMGPMGPEARVPLTGGGGNIVDNTYCVLVLLYQTAVYGHFRVSSV